MQNTSKPIDQFRSLFGHDDCKKYIWLLLKCGVTGGFDTLTKKEKRNLMFFYESVGELFNGIYGKDTYVE